MRHDQRKKANIKFWEFLEQLGNYCDLKEDSRALLGPYFFLVTLLALLFNPEHGYTLTINITVFNATLSTSVFNLVLLV
jgi:hypothetical protein